MQKQKKKQGRREEKVDETKKVDETEQADREAMLDEIDKVLEGIDECIQKHGKTTCPCGVKFAECFWYNDDGTEKDFGVPFDD